ncbi:hypothetical protein [Pedobacter sp. L105]|uniref:hypothetical protein n=1 Tax=Pedobacter sp. L105 TaxID=1641871 RepID=UPI00131A93ED|nr:hypothetical protein [Pedobacter sp. L105]
MKQISLYFYSNLRKSANIAVLLLLSHIAGAQESDKAIINSQYHQLIDAENQHNVDSVRLFVWNSTSTLFVAKTKRTEEGGWAGFWGNDVVMQHFHDILTGSTFHIFPEYDKIKTVFLKPEVAETYVPVKISVSYAGQVPVPKPFLMIIMWVKESYAWKLASDIVIPIPN